MAGRKNVGTQVGRPLQRMLEDALKAGADAVELEYVSEGLEVSYAYGNIGIGSVITDPKVARTIIDDLIECAGLEEKTDGRMSVELLGKVRIVSVEEWDSFGESAFRLTFT